MDTANCSRSSLATARPNTFTPADYPAMFGKGHKHKRSITAGRDSLQGFASPMTPANLGFGCRLSGDSRAVTGL
ncbi:hypothetical protein TsFJ059_003758 [Trichoderma semiorbis]|uniref:Uncharacterized protein n=1 Tax=Trichoderma semiorbis TaxID=1491008 RepID=A0A9P8HWB8_9HYPO|nr:hypothetical protein TsFJ059_003758 [Trichoderma semiorbis]